MADIKQAAKWMQEGKKVRRPKWFPDESMVASSQYMGGVDLIISGELFAASLLIESLLAEDWEIAAQAN